MKTTFLVILFVALMAASYALGLSVGERKAFAQATVLMNGAQADLAYNRIVDERKMVLILSKGCMSQLQDKLAVNVDQGTALLAEFFKGQLDPDSIKYISDCDPELVKSLATFKSKYGDSWVEKACSR